MLEEATPAKIDSSKKLELKLAAQDFNNRRAAYRREVSKLRIEYAQEVSQQKAADMAEKKALEKELTRQRLERQRLKNIRSAQNAIRQEELRKQRAEEFEEHLQAMQQKRDAKDERYKRARQMLIDELEEEAPLWLTTTEEVEAAFTPEAEQLLWARPGGVVGAPNPSLDCHFWQYQTHTWRTQKTYKSQRQFLLEQVEEMAYKDSNVDKSFWTPERLQKQIELEEKARLRAMVHSAGRTELLRKQRAMLYEDVNTQENEIPKPEPVPNLAVLTNQKALEKEGAQLLFRDPTQFFVFEQSPKIITEEEGESGGNTESETYSGPTLGAPIALRDHLREGSHQNRVFPEAIGKYPKPDTRTEREKKQEQRKDRLFAAALEAKTSGVDSEIADEDEVLDELRPDINYDEHQWDPDDEEWVKGLDPIADKHILDTPKELRFSEDDINWVIDNLEQKVDYHERQFGQEVENLQRSLASKNLIETERTQSTESEDTFVLDDILLKMSDKELLALSDLHDRYLEGLSHEEFTEGAKNVPSLTEEQLKFIFDQSSSQV